jgi:hypothetical protein
MAERTATVEVRLMYPRSHAISCHGFDKTSLWADCASKIPPVAGGRSGVSRDREFLSMTVKGLNIIPA